MLKRERTQASRFHSAALRHPLPAILFSFHMILIAVTPRIEMTLMMHMHMHACMMGSTFFFPSHVHGACFSFRFFLGLLFTFSAQPTSSYHHHLILPAIICITLYHISSHIICTITSEFHNIFFVVWAQQYIFFLYYITSLFTPSEP